MEPKQFHNLDPTHVGLIGLGADKESSIFCSAPPFEAFVLYVAILVLKIFKTKVPASLHQSPSEKWRGIVLAPHACKHRPHRSFISCRPSCAMPENTRRRYGSTTAVDPHLQFCILFFFANFNFSSFLVNHKRHIVLNCNGNSI